MRSSLAQIDGYLHCFSGVQHFLSLRNPTRVDIVFSSKNLGNQ